MTLLERRVSRNNLTGKCAYYLQGKRVSSRVYREESAKCHTFDSWHTVNRGGVTRFYSTGRL